MSGKINPPSGRLYVIYCDRCGRAVNEAGERGHWRQEQCGGCRMFKRHDDDYGFCRGRESVYCGRLMFEHDTCSKWEEGEW